MRHELEVLTTGLQMGESPRWHDGRLWLCDWGSGEVLVVDADGRRTTAARVAGLPFSIDWLPDGRLVAATPTGVRVGPDLAPHGALEQGWNEIVVDAAGRVFVDMPGSRPGEPPLPGTVAVVLPDGSGRVLAGELEFPNGLAITPDGSTLIVAESHGHRLTAFGIVTDDETGVRLEDRRTWADLGAPAAPDGICLDAEGCVWYADVPNRRCVRVAEGGAVQDVVEVDRGVFACMLGGEDGRTLFLVANSWAQGRAGDGIVLHTRVEVPHAGRP